LSTKLNKYGWGTVIGSILSPLILAAILFLAAGRIDLIGVWILTAVGSALFLAGTLILWKCDPELLNRRGAWKRRKDTRTLDKIYINLFGLFSFYVAYPIIGLDIGRFGWSRLDLPFVVLGYAFYVYGIYLFHTAMIENTHFEVTVRLQEDRGHKVVSTGPYAYVRHPGYVGAIFWVIGGPLALGSLYGLIPAIIGCAVLILRTNYEDKILQSELSGYKEYSQKVRWRLLPGIW